MREKAAADVRPGEISCLLPREVRMSTANVFEWAAGEEMLHHL